MHWGIDRWVSHFRLKRAALRFGDEGWTVTPGAWLESPGDEPARFACGRPDCHTSSCHPALAHWDEDATSDAAQIEEWWQDAPYSLLLATGHGIGVIEVPGLLGARAVRGPVSGPGRPSVTGVLRGPVAVTPQDRWMFFVREPGVPAIMRPELKREDILWHTRGSWVPLPPTRLRSGPVRWEVSPEDVQWHVPTLEQAQRALVDAAVWLDASLLESRLSGRMTTTAPRTGNATTQPLAARRPGRGYGRSIADGPMEVLRRAA